MNTFIVVLFCLLVVFSSSSTFACPSCTSGINSECYSCADCSISIFNGNCQCGDGSACQEVDSSCCANNRDVDDSIRKTFTCPSCATGINSECFTCAGCGGISIYNGECQCEDGSACKEIDSSCCSNDDSLTFTCPSCTSGINSECYTCADCSISIFNGNCQCGDGTTCQEIDSSCCNAAAHQQHSLIQPNRINLGCFLCSGTCCPDGGCYASGSMCCISGGACSSQSICCPPAPGSTTGGCCPAGSMCGPNNTCLSV